MRKLFTVIIIGLLFAACSSGGLDKQYNEKTAKEDMKNFTPEQSMYFTTAAMNSVFVADSKQIKDMTYSEILELGKELYNEKN